MELSQPDSPLALPDRGWGRCPRILEPESLIRLIVGSVGFGVLMGLRYYSSNIWIRAAIAGAAFAWLSLTCLRPWRARRS
jgi:hypothetical protein